MKVIRPAIIDTITTNVPDDSQPVWAVSTSYTAGQEVRYDRSIYEALDATTGDQPDISPLKWLRLRAENKWAMFSDQISDKTENADSIEVSFDPGIINALAMFGVNANSVEITMTDPVEGVVYEKEVVLLDDAGVGDWWAYFFEPINKQEDFVLLDLLPYGSATVSVKVIRTGETAKAGLLKVGRQASLGVAVFGTSIGDIDYSRKERDAFGRPIIVERNFAKRVSYDVTLDTNSANVVQKILRNLRTTPAVYIGDENREETIVYGFYKDFEIVLNNPSTSSANLEIEGLT